MSQIESITISILDEQDPHSLINFVPAKVRECALIHVGTNPELFCRDEEDFLKLAKLAKAPFNSTDHMIRDQFWIEYHHARSHGHKQMAFTRVFEGALSVEGFYRYYLKNPYKVAWMFTVPLDYRRQLRRNLVQLARNMAEIVDQPLIDPATGKFDKQMAQMQMNLLKFHEITLHGTPTQRIEQRNLNLSVTRTQMQEAIESDVGSKTQQTIKQIQDLESRLRRAQHIPKQLPHVPEPEQSPPVPTSDDE